MSVKHSAKCSWVGHTGWGVKIYGVPSAWSGADCRPEASTFYTPRIPPVYAIKNNGRMKQSIDLSGLDDGGNQKRLPTQLDTVVQKRSGNIRIATSSEGPPPWLPPLKERIAAEDIQTFETGVTRRITP